MHIQKAIELHLEGMRKTLLTGYCPTWTLMSRFHPMNDNIAIITVVEQLYHTHITASHQIHSDNDNRVYQLELADDQRWVLRIFSAENQSVSSLADILSLLKQQSYPAEQIVYATNNDTIVRHEL